MIDRGVITSSFDFLAPPKRKQREREGGESFVSLQKTIFLSSLLSFAGGSTDSSNHLRQRSGAGLGGGGGHLGAVERNSGGGKSRFMNRLKNGGRNVDLGFDDDDDDDVNEDDDGGFESRRFRGLYCN